MAIDIYDRICEIFGGGILDSAVYDESFCFVVLYDEKHPLHANKIDKFEESLCNLFDIDKTDIIFDYEEIPTRWILYMRQSGELHLKVYINKIPEYIMDELSCQVENKIICRIQDGKKIYYE